MSSDRVPDRPWWGKPITWIGVSAVLLVIGIVVAPKIFGFTLILLPFMWVSRRGVRRRNG